MAKGPSGVTSRVVSPVASVTDCMTGMARLISGDCDSAASPSLASAMPRRYLRLSLAPESATKPRAISVCSSANALLLETAILSASSVSVMPSWPAAASSSKVSSARSTPCRR